MSIITNMPYNFPQYTPVAKIDPYYDYNTLLLHMEGTNGSTAFVDSTNTALVVPGVGVTITNTQSKFGKTSANFTGNGGMSIPSSAFGASDFTIEMWIRPTNIGTSSILYDARPTSTSGAYPTLVITPTNVRYFSAGVTVDSLVSLVSNTWYHIAVSRVANVTRLFINGTQYGNSTTDNNTYLSGAILNLGTPTYTTGTVVDRFQGQMDEVRITKGIGRYNSNFIVPDGAFADSFAISEVDPYYSNTTLLVQPEGVDAFRDNSRYNNGLALMGTPEVSTLSPFASVGGSVKFDGASYLYTSTIGTWMSPESSSQFLLEFWFNTTTIAPATQTIYSKSSGFQVRLKYGTIYTSLSKDGSTSFFADQSFGTILPNTWYHVTLSLSSNIVTLYLNGIASGTISVDAAYRAIYTYQYPVNIGSNYGAGSNFNGYISNLRFARNVYKVSNFTPPTTPALSDIADTGMLLPLAGTTTVTNSVYNSDLVGKVLLRQVTKKYGTTSMYFNGVVGGKLNTTATDPLDTSDFTIEAWIYLLATGTTRRTIISNKSATATSAVTWHIGVESTGNLQYSVGSLTMTPAAALPVKIWTHVAMVRSGGVSKLYVDGTMVSQAADTNNYYVNSNGITIGGNGDGSEPFVGYIDDVRVTKGVARYTSNFVPVKAPFVTKDVSSFDPTEYSTRRVDNFEDFVTFQMGYDADDDSPIDTTRKNVLTNTGVAISTQVYVENASGYFDGASRIVADPSDNFQFGTEDFTVDFWINTTDANSIFFDTSSATVTGLKIGTLSGNTLVVYNGFSTATATINLGVWNHVAVVRNNDTWNVFVNGNLSSTVVGSMDYISGNLSIGAEFSNSSFLTGFLDNVRITKGVARYASNFVPTIK